MDMMRPQSVAVPPIVPNDLDYTIEGEGGAARVKLSWMDNSITETAFLVQRSTDGTTWVDVGTAVSPLNVTNTKDVVRSLTDTNTYIPAVNLQYRVIAQNTIGYGASANGSSFMSLTAESISDPLNIGGLPPDAPTNLVGTTPGGLKISLSFTDNATDETGFVLERASGGGFSQIAALGAGVTTYDDTTVKGGITYTYRVAAVNAWGKSDYATSDPITVTAFPAAPINVSVQRTGWTTANLVWRDNSTSETSFQRQISTDNGSTWTNVPGGATPTPDSAGTGSLITTSITVSATTNARYRVQATNATGSTASVSVVLKETLIYYYHIDLA